MVLTKLLRGYRPNVRSCRPRMNQYVECKLRRQPYKNEVRETGLGLLVLSRSNTSSEDCHLRNSAVRRIIEVATGALQMICALSCRRSR